MNAERAVIVGQGPSFAAVAPSEVGRVRSAGVAVIAVNGAIEHVPADYFFTLDLSDENRARIADPVPGVKYVVAAPEPEEDQLPHVTYLTRVAVPVPRTGSYADRAGQEAPGGLSEAPGAIHTGNSAFGALNFAYLMGATRIALLGVDGFGYKRWDGTYNRYLEHMPELFASAVPQLTERGIHVVNGSPESSVDCFPRLTPHDALDWLVNGDGPWTGESITPPPREPSPPPPAWVRSADPAIIARAQKFAERARQEKINRKE